MRMNYCSWYKSSAKPCLMVKFSKLIIFQEVKVLVFNLLIYVGDGLVFNLLLYAPVPIYCSVLVNNLLICASHQSIALCK